MPPFIPGPLIGLFQFGLVLLDGPYIIPPRTLLDISEILIERHHRDLITSLGEVRERLAHIEGHLRIQPPPTTANDTTAEAA